MIPYILTAGTVLKGGLVAFLLKGDNAQTRVVGVGPSDEMLMMPS
jgi:hypothetical protein